MFHKIQGTGVKIQDKDRRFQVNICSDQGQMWGKPLCCCTINGMAPAITRGFQLFRNKYISSRLIKEEGGEGAKNVTTIKIFISIMYQGKYLVMPFYSKLQVYITFWERITIVFHKPSVLDSIMGDQCTKRLLSCFYLSGIS